jgi:cyclin-dependent kinase-like
VVADDDVVKKTTLREVKLLRMLRNQNNVVYLHDAFRRKGKLYLVFEYVQRNLLEVLDLHPDGLDPELVRRFVFQLCLAIEWCHRNSVIHRDIKPENLLVSEDNHLKLCDFGFARSVTKKQKDLTDYVATRWYRAPELLLGSTSYDLTVDVWAIGCIMGELADGQPLFPGENEVDQLYIIQQAMGPLTSKQMELFLKNARFRGLSFPPMTTRGVDHLTKRYVGKLSEAAIDFQRSCLHMDPLKRLSAVECLRHPWFAGLCDEFGWTPPLATPRGAPASKHQTETAPTSSDAKGSADDGDGQRSSGASSLQDARDENQAETAASTPMAATKAAEVEGSTLLSGGDTRPKVPPLLAEQGSPAPLGAVVTNVMNAEDAAAEAPVESTRAKSRGKSQSRSRRQADDDDASSAASGRSKSRQHKKRSSSKKSSLKSEAYSRSHSRSKVDTGRNEPQRSPRPPQHPVPVHTDPFHDGVAVGSSSTARALAREAAARDGLMRTSGGGDDWSRATVGYRSHPLAPTGPSVSTRHVPSTTASGTGYRPISAMRAAAAAEVSMLEAQEAERSRHPRGVALQYHNLGAVPSAPESQPWRAQAGVSSRFGGGSRLTHGSGALRVGGGGGLRPIEPVRMRM